MLGSEMLIPTETLRAPDQSDPCLHVEVPGLLAILRGDLDGPAHACESAQDQRPAIAPRLRVPGQANGNWRDQRWPNLRADARGRRAALAEKEVLAVREAISVCICSGNARRAGRMRSATNGFPYTTHSGTFTHRP